MTPLVGFGYDVHRLIEGRPMILGGFEIPDSPVGPVAHSDGDVLIHAICDALLGAVGEADIGTHFPDTDEQWAGADSRGLLKRVMLILADRSAELVNVDSTLVLEHPKIGPHRVEIRDSLAALLGLPPERVGVKATTNEQLGPIGRGEGIAAYAVVSILLR